MYLLASPLGNGAGPAHIPAREIRSTINSFSRRLAARAEPARPLSPVAAAAYKFPRSCARGRAGRPPLRVRASPRVIIVPGPFNCAAIPDTC